IKIHVAVKQGRLNKPLGTIPSERNCFHRSLHATRIELANEGSDLTDARTRPRTGPTLYGGGRESYCELSAQLASDPLLTAPRHPSSSAPSPIASSVKWKRGTGQWESEKAS
ncbi:hypothetical protein GWI33_003954, partial [Rhynchophorus ferrugineus]